MRRSGGGGRCGGDNRMRRRRWSRGGEVDWRWRRHRAAEEVVEAQSARLAFASEARTLDLEQSSGGRRSRGEATRGRAEERGERLGLRASGLRSNLFAPRASRIGVYRLTGSCHVGPLYRGLCGPDTGPHGPMPKRAVSCLPVGLTPRPKHGPERASGWLEPFYGRAVPCSGQAKIRGPRAGPLAPGQICGYICSSLALLSNQSSLQQPAIAA